MSGTVQGGLLVTPQEEISAALRKAGLPEIEGTLGSSFVFSSTFDTEFVLLAGTITAVQLSDNLVDLYVSAPKFWCFDLDRLTYHEGDVWAAKIVSDTRSAEMYLGYLKLIP